MHISPSIMQSFFNLGENLKQQYDYWFQQVSLCFSRIIWYAWKARKVSHAVGRYHNLQNHINAIEALDTFEDLKKMKRVGSFGKEAEFQLHVQNDTEHFRTT